MHVQNCCQRSRGIQFFRIRSQDRVETLTLKLKKNMEAFTAVLSEAVLVLSHWQHLPKVQGCSIKQQAR